MPCHSQQFETWLSLCLGIGWEPPWMLSDVGQSIALSEQMLRRQINRRISGAPILIDSLFVLLICIDKNTQVFNLTNGHFWPTLFPYVTNASSLTPLSICLPLPPFCLSPHSILPVENSHKYSADLMRRSHCSKLIESKRMFHLGIPHNR